MHLVRTECEGDFAYDLVVLLLGRGGRKEGNGRREITRKKWELPHATPRKMYDAVDAALRATGKKGQLRP